MSSTRPNLKLDERSFEALLAAAYTVQQHNANQKRAASVPCGRCGSMIEPEHKFCGHCGAQREEFRPGERMQRKWATLWSMSQSKSGEQNSRGPDSPAGAASPVIESIDGDADFFGPVWPDSASAVESIATEEGTEISESESMALVLHQQDFGEDPEIEDPELERSNSWSLPIVLRFRREDLYLGLAILVSALALLWVIWASPVSRGWEKERLTLWQRALVKIGIAEAPRAPSANYGDPTVKVWADPHTALYYCYGDEQFGKTPGGHVSTQREAQIDRFSPAARTPCE
jgi:hypothetical protein